MIAHTTSVTFDTLEPRRLLSSVAPLGDPMLIDNQPGAHLWASREVGTDAAGNAVVVWNAPDGSGSGVFAQRVDASGNKLGESFRINQTTANTQNQASVDVASDGSFVVAWADEGFHKNGSQFWNIFLRRYDASGQPLGNEIQVTNASAGETHWTPAVAVDSSGNSVVIWTGPQKRDRVVFGRMYNAAGQARGNAFNVTIDRTGGSANPYVDMDQVGNFIVAYTNSGTGTDVFAQRYTAAGAKTGSELRLNADAAGAQDQVRVEMTASGAFVAVWRSESNGTSDIRGRRFAASGIAAGNEFRVNEGVDAVGRAHWPSLDVLDDGSFAVGWTHNHADAGQSVYARVFNAGSSPIGGPLILVSSRVLDDDTSLIATAHGVQVAARPDGGFAAVWQRTERIEDGVIERSILCLGYEADAGA